MLHAASLAAALLAFWLLLSGHSTPLMLGFARISVGLVLLVGRRMEAIDHEGHPLHLRLARTPGYAVWLAGEIVKANLDVAETRLKRRKETNAHGPAPPSSVDEAVRQFELAKAQHDSAKEQESLVDEGARGEEIRVAEEQVKQAETALAQAKDNRAKTKVSADQIEELRP